MRLKPFYAMLFAIGAQSAVFQPAIAQTGSTLTEQIIPAGDTTYRGPFTVDPATGAVNGSGKVEWRNGNRYEGPVRNNQLTGKGKFTWINGDRYEGDMVNAEPHGQGTYYFKGGDRYNGAWNNGQKHGQGRYTFADGSYWEGQYANDRQVSGAMGNLGGSAADASKVAEVSSGTATQPAREALPVVAAEPKRESIQQAKAGSGDPNKYSTTPGNPNCRFFDGFADNGDGTVTDPRTQLVWKRCAEGQTWNGAACTGHATAMDWFDAMQAAKNNRFLGKNDWRLPSSTEFNAVIGDYGGGCKNNSNKHNDQNAVSGDLGNGDYYWSYSPSVNYGYYAWSVNFNRGFVGEFYRSDIGSRVRLVRASQPSGGAAALVAFNAEYKKMGAYKAEVLAEEKRAAKRREEEARKEQARKQQELKEVADRLNRSVTRLKDDDQARKRQEIQEAKRREAEEKRRIAYEKSPEGRASAREAEARAQRSQLCRAQVATCVASCPRMYSYTIKEYTDWPEASCQSRCEAVRCN